MSPTAGSIPTLLWQIGSVLWTDRGGRTATRQDGRSRTFKGLSGGVDGALTERQIRWVAEDLIEHSDRLAPGRRDDFGAAGGVLIGDIIGSRCPEGLVSSIKSVPRRRLSKCPSAEIRYPRLGWPKGPTAALEEAEVRLAEHMAARRAVEVSTKVAVVVEVCTPL